MPPYTLLWSIQSLAKAQGYICSARAFKSSFLVLLSMVYFKRLYISLKTEMYHFSQELSRAPPPPCCWDNHLDWLRWALPHLNSHWSWEMPLSANNMKYQEIVSNVAFTLELNTVTNIQMTNIRTQCWLIRHHLHIELQLHILKWLHIKGV